MPDYVIEVAALVAALGAVAAVILLWLRGRRTARDDAAMEQRVENLLASRAPPRTQEEPADRRRRMWLVTAVAGLVSAASWLRHHPGPVLGTIGSVAALMTLMITGSSSDTRRADPPNLPPILAPEVPSSTTALPTPAPATTTTAPTSVPTTQALRPPPPTVTTTPTATITTTSQPPTSTTSAAQRCLLDVELRPLLRLCLPAVH